MLTEDTVTGQYSCAIMPLPPPVLALDRGTGANLKQSLDAATAIPLLGSLVEESRDAFVADVSACDRASANNVCEDASAIDSGRARLRMPCFAHVAATAQGRAFQAVQVELDGIICLGIVMRGNGGSAVELRDCIAKVLVSRFVGIVDAPPRGPEHPETLYKRDLLRQCLPVTDEGRMRFQYLMRELTGDIREHTITLKIVGGSAAAFDIQAWARSIAESLLPSAIETFPRHRWVNSLSRLCHVSLLTVHGVLAPAVMLFLSGGGCGGTVSAPSSAPQPDTAAWCLSSDSQQEVVPAQQNVVASDKNIAAAHPESMNGYTQFSNAQKAKCKRWSRSRIVEFKNI